jgi:hypothetical protein
VSWFLNKSNPCSAVRLPISDGRVVSWLLYKYNPCSEVGCQSPAEV